jgi:uncharacterized membrane protein HdeD (DUF308 family)
MNNHSNVTNEQARKTALVVAAVLIALAAWNIYRGRMTVVTVLGGIGIVLLIIGFFLPAAARGFHRFWMGFAGILGYINSRILLTVLYYLVMTPYGFMSRLVGRDPLMRRGAAQETYWIKRENTRQTRNNLSGCSNRLSDVA